MASADLENNPQFSDLSRTLEQAPSGDIEVKKDGGAIENALVNIILTRKGERLHQPDFGTNFLNLKHSLMGPNFEEDVRTELNDAFNQEPRAQLQAVDIEIFQDQSTARITVKWGSPYLIGSQVFQLILGE